MFRPRSSLPTPTKTRENIIDPVYNPDTNANLNHFLLTAWWYKISSYRWNDIILISGSCLLHIWCVYLNKISMFICVSVVTTRWLLSRNGTRGVMSNSGKWTIVVNIFIVALKVRFIGTVLHRDSETVNNFYFRTFMISVTVSLFLPVLLSQTPYLLTLQHFFA